MQSNLNPSRALGEWNEKSSAQFINGEPSPGVLALIRRFEGRVLHPYRCPAGVWTIGYGHVLTQSQIAMASSGINEAQADAWLWEDTARAQRAVLRLTAHPLKLCQYEALTSFVFNLGPAAYQRSALRQAVNRGDRVEREWMRWVWAKGQKLPGLVTRRAAELAHFTG